MNYTFLGRAHAIAVKGDRILRVKGIVRGKWYEDAVINYVNGNQFRICRILDETEDTVTVELMKEGEE